MKSESPTGAEEIVVGLSGRAEPRRPSLAPSDAPLSDLDSLENTKRTTITIGSAALVLKGEDACAMSTSEVAGENLFIALVADGHGGKAAGRHCKAMVIDAVLQALREAGNASAGSVRDAGRAAFLRAHAEVMADESTTAGSTLKKAQGMMNMLRISR